MEVVESVTVGAGGSAVSIEFSPGAFDVPGLDNLFHETFRCYSIGILVSKEDLNETQGTKNFRRAPHPTNLRPCRAYLHRSCERLVFQG
jgi:hypothetical protein